ncbi:MAG: hypothetical protein SO115_08965, partial [Sodaliphilus sp.]|nr:hypothetical protein [Sodaliphilus sp.]
PNSNSFHTKKRFPKNRENASIAVIFFQKNAPCPQKSPKNTYIFSAFDISKALKNYKNSECSKDFVEACSRWKRLIMVNSMQANERSLEIAPKRV